MTFGLVVVANGRGELLTQTMAALNEQLPPFDTTLICDDSGRPEFADWLRSSWPAAQIDAHPHLGHGPAVARAWSLAGQLPVEHVFWMEEDMILRQPLDLQCIADVLRSEKNLVQMVFKRPAHFPLEIEHGGMLERFGREPFKDRGSWMEHRLFYSLNPHVVSTAFLRKNRWPPVPNSEHRFSRRLFTNPRVRVGMWGRWEDEPVVLHAGTGPRTGTGY